MKRNLIAVNYYCINCGKENIPIFRNNGRMRESQHRKKMYCPWCKKIVNMVECRTEEEVKDFKEKFMNGDYEEEATQSIDFYNNNSLDNLFDKI